MEIWSRFLFDPGRSGCRLLVDFRGLWRRWLAYRWRGGASIFRRVPLWWWFGQHVAAGWCVVPRSEDLDTRPVHEPWVNEAAPLGLGWWAYGPKMVCGLVRPCVSGLYLCNIVVSFYGLCFLINFRWKKKSKQEKAVSTLDIYTNGAKRWRRDIYESNKSKGSKFQKMTCTIPEWSKKDTVATA